MPNGDETTLHGSKRAERPTSPESGVSDHAVVSKHCPDDHQESGRPWDILSAVLDSISIRFQSAQEIVQYASSQAMDLADDPALYVVLAGQAALQPYEAPSIELAAGDALLIPTGPAETTPHDDYFSPPLPITCSTKNCTCMQNTAADDGQQARLLVVVYRQQSPQLHPLCLGLPRAIPLPQAMDVQCQPVLAPAIASMQAGVGRRQAGGLLHSRHVGPDCLYVESLRQALTHAAPVSQGLLQAICDADLAPVLNLVYRKPAEDWSLESLAAEGLHVEGVVRPSLQIVDGRFAHGMDHRPSHAPGLQNVGRCGPGHQADRFRGRLREPDVFQHRVQTLVGANAFGLPRSLASNAERDSPGTSVNLPCQASVSRPTSRSKIFCANSRAVWSLVEDVSSSESSKDAMDIRRRKRRATRTHQ